ncbi:MAG: MFS transporter [Chloroflexota bacterium]
MADSTFPAPAGNWQKTLYILFVSQLFTAVGFSSIFPFLPFYVEELGATTGLSVEVLAGLVFSAQAFTMMLASPIWGMLADRYGRKLMVERSMFGGTVILLLMAFARSAEELVALRAIQGLITGTVAAASALAAASVPRGRAGYAMGLLQVGLGSGVALGPLIGGAIADAYGYYAAFYVTAALLFLSGVLVAWGVQEQFDKASTAANRPSGVIAEWWHILSTPGVLTTYGLRFISQLGRMVMVPILPLFIQTLMTDTSRLNTFTGLVVGVGSATTTLSSIYLGRLGDRVGHRRVVLISALAAAGLYGIQSRVEAGWQLLILQALVGVALGGIIPIISALLATFTQADEAGAVYGLDNSINAGGRALAPLLGSAVAVWFDLRATFMATALLFLITVILALRFLPSTKGHYSRIE